jgi:urea transport system permease protein
MFFRNNLLLGGNNGFTDFKFILGHSLVDPQTGPATMRGLYIATGVTLLVVYALCRWLGGTKFGLVQRAIRDGENRVLFSGYAAANYKLFIFVLAAVIASIGGALYVPQAGIINPEEMKPEKSLEAVVWVAVGGRGTLLGPILGAVTINALKSWATTGATANYWLIILGGLFIVVVLFLPGGLVSLPSRLAPYWKKFRRSSSPPEVPDGQPAPTSRM